MKFFIVTPTFNSLRWLPGCIASVRNQVSDGGVGCDVLGVKPERLDYLNPKTQHLKPSALPITVHHHIQDGGSTDGTVDWLRQYDAEVRRQQSEVSNPKTSNLKPNTAVPGYTFSYASEPDNGMYDALNKGIELTFYSISSNGNAIPNIQYPITNNQTVWLFEFDY